FERTAENAFKTVAFDLLDGPFIIDEPYNQQHTYRYLLRFSSDPFPEGEGLPGGSLLDYYGWRREEEQKAREDQMPKRSTSAQFREEERAAFLQMTKWRKSGQQLV